MPVTAPAIIAQEEDRMGQSQPHRLLERQDSLDSFGHKLIAATRRVWARYWMRRAARATAGILHTLDDRALKDIGLDRSEIESVACECRTRSSRAPERRACLC
jgi:uncharacterized protein YjiS (DUF1127 family)